MDYTGLWRVRGNLLRLLLRAWLVVCLGIGSTDLARAQSDLDHGEIPVERAVWVDTTGKASPEEAMQQTFSPVNKIVSRGYQSTVTWMRVTVPASDVRNAWLTIQPLYLDDVRVYTPVRSADGSVGQWLMRQEGDRFPFHAKERRTLLYSLALDTHAHHPTVIYVRLDTQSTHALSVKVRTSGSALEYEAHILIGLGIYCGIVLTFMVLSALRYGFTRDEMWLWTVVFHAVTIFHALVNLGLFAKYFMPETPSGVDRWASSTFCLHLFVAVFYYWRFITVFHGPRWTTRPYQLVMLVFPFQLWLIWSGNTRLAMNLNTSLLLLITIWGGAIAWFMRIHDPVLKHTVRLAFTIQSAYLLVFAMPLMGVGEMTELHLYPALLSNLLASVLLYVMLSRRDQLAFDEKNLLEQSMVAAKSQLESKQRQLTQSAGFIAMLLHELKSPLATIKLAALNIRREAPDLRREDLVRLEHIQAATVDMDTLLERCKQVDRFESGTWSANPMKFDLAQLLRQRIEATRQSSRIVASAPAELHVTADAVIAEISMDNLLDNALAYSPKTGVVAVSLEAEGDTKSASEPACWKLTVRNTVGKVGLPEPDRLFQKYYRAPRAHQLTGSGLGLYLVKNLAETSGGTLTYQPETDENGMATAVFTLRMPSDAAA